MAGQPKTLAPPEPSRFTALGLIALALLGAALTALAWGAPGTVPVRVDGRSHDVAIGSTIADLQRDGLTTAHRGSLLSVYGKLLKAGGGRGPAYSRDGRPAVAGERVYADDAIESVNGSDTVERVVSVRIAVDPTATITGTGPILKLVRAGKPGIDLVSKGAISGEVLSRTTLQPAIDIALEATMPTSADKIVALTFDDGPWPNSTLKILAILKQAGVHATFFEIGQQVGYWPQLSRAIVADGNIIGNHSWSHPFLNKMKPPQIRKQLLDTAAAIKRATGVAPTVFRPPYGAVNHNVWNQARVVHETVTLWDVDSLDWTRPGPSKILSNVTSHMGRASIVLMHDGGGPRQQTIAALPNVIAWLKANGYTFVTVPELQAAR